MRRFTKAFCILVAGVLPVALAQTMKAPDITREPTLYVVPYAHLDTQWRWEFPQSISEYLLKTMRVNFDYMEKYPHYVFNWTGANRYRLMKEYFPADYARVKRYVAEGRWYPAGSSMEEGDVNAPSAEAILRQVLYGNTYFRRDFGKASAEYMLPDCFGFPASLPSILAHAGVKGFSTQKLSANWQPAPHVGGPGSPEQTPEGIPFNVGIWEGPDGKTVIAALNPETYTSTVFSDLSKEPPPAAEPPATAAGRGGRGPREQEQDWVKRIGIDGKATGVFADYHYMGTGDIGGAVNESSVKLIEAIVTQGTASLTEGAPRVKVGDGPVHVVEATADQMFLDIKPAMTERMPRWKGDLELINHSAGSLTSEAYHKRWNRQNEVLADAAEKASVAAEWMGARDYPQQRLNDAWTLVMGGHFHDTMAGTATPRSYEFAWNDDLIARNQFHAVLNDATAAVSASLNTQGWGRAVVVYNPLNIARQDVVEAGLFQGAPKAVRVVGPDGQPVPAQIEGGKVLFLARAPSVGYAVYDVEPVAAAAESAELKVTSSSLENARYQVKIDGNGDVASIFDKALGKELLSAPIRLALSTDAPRQWPAWNMDWDQVHAAPRAYVSGPAKIRVVENGPVRVAVEVTREAEGSKFVQTIRLAAGDAGNRVEFQNAIDWRGLATNLKAVFPLSASNPNATYNWNIGTVERPTENERQFEVASHQWIDLTDHAGAYGATILTDCKNGSDKFDDRTIRLTLLRTPGFRPDQAAGRRGYSDQLNQDWGHHEFVFGIAGHAGDWRRAETDWQAERLNDPLLAFESPHHSGALGREFSLLRVNNSRVRVMALKKAEMSDELIVRLVELDGKPQQDVRVTFAAPVADAREANGQEQPLGPEAAPAVIAGRSLTMRFEPYQPRTFAFKLGAPAVPMAPVRSQPVTLAYDLAGATNDDTKAAGGFDGKGNAMPAEMLPTELTVDGVRFALAAAGTGKPNAVVAKGQAIDLPAGEFNRVWLLAASAEGDRRAVFHAGSQAVDLTVQDWGGFIGQWDTRIWKGPATPERWEVSANHAVWDLSPGAHNERRGYQPRYPQDYVSLKPGFLKPAELAWYCSHHHTAEGLNEPYAYSYLFAYAIDLPAGAKTLTLPNDDKIRVLAVSVEDGNPATVPPAAELY
jgi:alpha-mannosidase